MSNAGPDLQLRKLCRTAARQIVAECEGQLAAAVDSGANTDDRLAGCGTPLVSLLLRQARLFLLLYDASAKPHVSAHGAQRLLAARLRDLADTAYGRFYAVRFAVLPACWRHLYTTASLLTFGVLVFKGCAARRAEEPVLQPGSQDRLDELVRPLDLAIILAGAPTPWRAFVDGALELLEELWEGSPPPGTPDASGLLLLKKRKRKASDVSSSSSRPLSVTPAAGNPWTAHPPFPLTEPFTPPVTHPVPRAQAAPSLESFQVYLDSASSSASPSSPAGPHPLILPGLTAAWPARTSRPWNRPAYLRTRTLAGRRLVPVEVGRSYVDAAWAQQLLPLGALLDQHMGAAAAAGAPPPTAAADPTPTPTIYLAQHELLAQIPALRRDVAVPDLAYTTPPPDPTAPPPPPPPQLDEPLVNAWLGPAGTITPLHTDPYHNLLAQVVGRKYVRLYAPGASMRARGIDAAGVDMTNTSLWDVGVEEGWDERGREAEAEEGEEGRETVISRVRFKDVPFVDCILDEGDTLYIPAGWWHYVRSLTASFSVSFWWN